MPLEGLDQCLGFGGWRDDRLSTRGRFDGDADPGSALFGSTLLQGGQDISYRVGFAHDADWETYPKHPLDTQDQFGSAEAIDTEIAIEPAGQSDVQGGGA